MGFFYIIIISMIQPIFGSGLVGFLKKKIFTRKKNTNVSLKRDSSIESTIDQSYENYRIKREEKKQKFRMTSPKKTFKIFSQKKSNSSVKKKFYKKAIKYLRNYCISASGCLAFGEENDLIKTIFDNFSFKYTNENSERLKTSDSINGFQHLIQYDNDGYKTTALLKSSIEEQSDNLYYEYLVGQYINKMNLLYPCFTETYHLFLNKSDVFKKKMMKRNEKTIPTQEIVSNFEIQDTSMTFKLACQKSAMLAILVQYVNNSISINDYLHSNVKNRDCDLTQMLFQLYGPLAIISKTYTHNDLHFDNILLYQLDPGCYIEMKYKYKSHEVKFKTHVIAKIIDYGKSYFSDESSSTADIYKKVCKVSTCGIDNKLKGEDYDPKIDCGRKQGFQHFNPNPLFRRTIVNSVANISSDLRLAHMLKLQGKQKKIDSLLKKIEFKGPFYTPEIENVQNLRDDKDLPKIRNIIEMNYSLTRLMNGENFITQNEERYEGFILLGQLTIYMDDKGKKMIFKPHSIPKLNQNKTAISKKKMKVKVKSESKSKSKSKLKTRIKIESSFKL
jgi:hypothetical protein